VGLMSWMRGGDEESGSSSVMGAAMTAIDGIFRPSRLKQLEYIAEAKRKRLDVANGSDIDLDNGRAVIRVARSSGNPVRQRAPRAYPPRRQGWWKRLRTSMHRRQLTRARAKTVHQS
jgi:hypothetical protein